MMNTFSKNHFSKFFLRKKIKIIYKFNSNVLSLSAYVYLFPGRSMGARTAVAVCNRMCDRQKDAVQGVLCLSFPLNVPGKPQTFVERSHGLHALSQTSVLFVSGTADNMCQQNLLQNVMLVMKSPSAVHWVKDANHGLAVRGRTEESVLEEVNSQIIAWVLQHK
uniref:Testis expressed 30 n=1 Tax=Sinocyclocheilus grahami TaxID=75366 RepID=A0A672Q0W9_SINGR